MGLREGIGPICISESYLLDDHYIPRVFLTYCGRAVSIEVLSVHPTELRGNACQTCVLGFASFLSAAA
jgi:hypothetical protein